MKEHRPHILFVNRSYWPDTEATGQLLTDLCEDLAADFSVEVLAGWPNHIDHSGSRPVRRQEHNGVTIRRVWHTRFAKSSFIGKAINLLTFTVSVFLATLWRRRPDVVITETDPFFLPLLGWWLRSRYQCRFVVWLQDLYPDVAVAVGKIREGWLTRMLRRALVAACNGADRVVVLSRAMRERCLRNGVEERRLQIIHNWADCRRIHSIKHENRFRRTHGLEGRFVVMYSGNLGQVHVLSPLLDAAEYLQFREDLVFVFVGEGVQRRQLEQEALARNLRNVRFLPYQPREALGESLSAADLHVVSVLPSAEGCVMPSKLYGALASGTSVLALCAADSDLADVVRQHEVGEVCDASQLEDLAERVAEAVIKVAMDPTERRRQEARARRVALAEFDRESQVRRFARLLGDVLGRDAEPALVRAIDAAAEQETSDAPTGEPIATRI